ncbi:MAG: GNAT family N-acetyltransferase [Geodermatophilaceae bacterium]
MPSSTDSIPTSAVTGGRAVWLLPAPSRHGSWSVSIRRTTRWVSRSSGRCATAVPTDQSSVRLYAINLDPDVWGRGLGQRLLLAATAELSRLGFPEAVLWVATGNSRARRFYEAAGWAADGMERTDDSFGPPIDEVRYRRLLP